MADKTVNELTTLDSADFGTDDLHGQQRHRDREHFRSYLTLLSAS